MRQVIRNRMLYRLREQEGSRLAMALRWMLADFPRRLARGILGTASSQPPGVTLQAYGDLLQIAPRLVSKTYDEKQWRRYLNTLGWPPAPQDERPSDIASPQEAA